MSRCDEIRDLFTEYLEGTLGHDRHETVVHHLAECHECAELLDDFRQLLPDDAYLTGLEAPAVLHHEIAASPCRRWLGLLFSAIDREISDANVERLFAHLEACPECRAAWSDMTLIHQVGEAIEPPQHLLARCLRPRRRVGARRVLSQRTATAAAYVLAILVSAVISNPVTARYDASSTVQRVTAVVGSEVTDAAQTGKGEVRVMLWRALTMGQRTADAVRSAWTRITNTDSSSRDDVDENKETTS